MSDSLPAVLAVDQGTHASRAIVFNLCGTPLVEAHKEVVLNRIGDLSVEQDADEILNSVRYVFDEASSSLPGGYYLQSIGLATQRSSVVAWNRSGSALSPVLSWQDRRALNDIILYDSFSGKIREKTGLPLSPHYGATKLRWLLENNAAVRRAFVEKDLLIGPLVSYLVYNLVDKVGGKSSFAVDHANASRTLLMNIRMGLWDDDLLKLFNIDKKLLPEIKPVISDYGKWNNIPLTAVSGDQNAALFSEGSLPENTALVNLGSGAFILKPTRDFISHKNLLTGLSCSDSDGITFTLEGTVNGCSTALDWAKNQLAIDYEINLNNIFEFYDNELNADEIPLFINTVGGVGSPFWKSGKAPYWKGKYNDPQIALLAVLESILFLIKINFLEIQNSGQRTGALVVSGGLSQSDRLCQKLADICGVDVNRVYIGEATSRGIACLAAGQPSSWEKKPMKLFKPSHYEESDLEKRFKTFYEIMKEL